MAHDHHDHVDDEMHELNEEADYLENKLTVDANGVNGHKTRPPPSGNSDPDAQAQVIESLRSQVQDLFSQVTQLNGKLVRSYDRVSDLEDELHVTSSNLRNCTIKVGQLELERTQHLSALSTGLLVEKSHVTSELTRLMEKATEEAARAGQAENARNAIEKELDDLSAGLFDQANRMVAEARFARAQSERKVEETERALKGAEEIVGVLQAQMQALQAEKENADKRVEEIRALMGKGKWVDRPVTSGRSERMRLLCLHAPYTEYVQFIVHLRTIRPSTANPPPITTLLPLPFLARLVVEDSDPTVRLDMAPSLNWLSRRSVISAIHAGQLTIEPMSTATLLEELSAASSIPGNSHNTHVTCALCGTSIIEPPTSPNRATSFPMSPARTLSGGKGTWSPAFLKNSLQSITASPFTQSSRPTTPTVQVSMEPPDHVFIFRLENTSSGGISVSIPLTSPQPPAAQRPPTIYPLCASGWCLARLRTTCSLWSFIRTSVVEKVWEEEPHPATSTNLSLPKRQPSDSDTASQETVASKQTIQPKRSRMGIGALWGSMSRTLSGVPKEAERAESPKPKEETVNGNVNKPVPPVPPRRMPPPPPQHPPLAAPVPRPATAAGPPPPLPKRNRQRTASPQPQDKPAADASTPAEEKSGLLSPPEEEEAFATPIEEIAAPTLARPMTPSAIPLPPSVPATPVHAPLERPAAPATPPPIRLSDDRPPSRSGSPAPPPLPRRAAGRARPTSLALVSGPETEAGAAAEAKPDAPATEEAPKEAEAEHPKPVEKIEEAAEETEEPVSAAAPAVEDQPHNSSTSDVSAVHESEKVSLQDVPLATDSERETDNSHENANEDVSKALKVDGTGSPESMSVSERSAEDDPRLYVGEGTWEERAWREIVKLREEMFWARVGGVR